ncbi:ADP-ribosylglycohydrolase family protein [Prosthecochloris sp. CIB 2401]|uniref:ADP-ribosylglycohydrolase family protein n=1 Tax=Prosthecochloris sp. CIB 2401 TaxID=1868325 RepID=UPI00080ABB55|nr:ADP-ribosylglycohydrolase family protein [Prosthecochloris sp. CIB 2401]ANT65278.1 ADP-ribosyl-[dinitrogen reductase] hydrolase [Prosthecochloris sp. CIB 2401]
MGIDRTSRAQGCLLGQLAGDALGSLVEFQSPDEIRRSYPDGVRELADGGTWNTIAGQPTNALFAMGIAYAIQSGCDGKDLYQHIRQWSLDMPVEPALLDTIDKAAEEPPADYVHQQGWVMIAFQNALYQLLQASNLEEGVVDTIMRGGDTDTNAAICGALLGAVCGRDAIPAQWLDGLQNCRPEAGHPRVRHPRPECFWPVDVLELAEGLVKTRVVKHTAGYSIGNRTHVRSLFRENVEN